MENYKKNFLKLDLPVWVAFLAMMTLGWFLKDYVQGKTVAFAEDKGSLRIQYPEAWLPTPKSDALLELQDPLSSQLFSTTLKVWKSPRDTQKNLEQIMLSEVSSRSQKLDFYRMLQSQNGKIAEKEAVKVDYTYVADPQPWTLDPERRSQRIPVVVKGAQWIIPGDQWIYHIDFQAASEQFETQGKTFQKILEGVRL